MWLGSVLMKLTRGQALDVEVRLEIPRDLVGDGKGGALGPPDEPADARLQRDVTII